MKRMRPQPAPTDPPQAERREFLRKFSSATFAGLVLAGLNDPEALAQEIVRADPQTLPPPVPRDPESEREFESILSQHSMSTT